MTEEQIIDPFASEDVKPLPKPSKKDLGRTQPAERGTYTQETLANATRPGEGLESLSLPRPQNGELTGTYSRVEELAETPGFYKLEEIAGLDLVIVGIHPALSGQYKDRDGSPAEYAVCEFYFARPEENPDNERGEAPYSTVVGGLVSLPRLKSAAKKIIEGKASGPLVAAFEQQYTSAGQMFWNVR